MNNLQVLSEGLQLTLDAHRQYRFMNRFLKPMVKSICSGLHYTLTPAESKKVLFYYPMYTVLACGEMYVSMLGRNLTTNERKKLTLVGAMATLCDDLIDEDRWSREEIFGLLSNKINPGVGKKVQLLLAMNNQLKTFWPPSENYLNQLKIALEWQALSGKQSAVDITLDEIVHICREKNGQTSLMFATLIEENWTSDQLACIYQSAIVGQLTNDSFDIYFDTQNGIHTYFNTAQSVRQVRDFFLQECRLLHKMVRECSVSPKHALHTIRRMSVLHAFTLTALDHLQKTEAQMGGKITNWKDVERKFMVTDMAKNTNRFKTIGYMKWLSKQ